MVGHPVDCGVAYTNLLLSHEGQQIVEESGFAAIHGNLFASRTRLANILASTHSHGMADNRIVQIAFGIERH